MHILASSCCTKQRMFQLLHADVRCYICSLLPITCSSANGMQQKLYNWNTLNSKVLKRLGLQLTKQHMQEIALCTPGAIEQALQVLKLKIAAYQEPR
jgi:hypothetical protein